MEEIYWTRKNNYEIVTNKGGFVIRVGKPFVSQRHSSNDIVVGLDGKYDETDLILILKALRHYKKNKIIHKK